MDSVNKLFDNLDKWRHLPSYQLERRADVFFSAYIGYLLEGNFGYEIDQVIPEFPVRIGTIDPNVATNQSFKIDYLASVMGENKIIFLELKTDDRSRRGKQDWYLMKAQKVGIVRLLNGLVDIYKATKSKRKYKCLFAELQEMGLITLADIGKVEVVQRKYDIEINYLQPNKIVGEKNIISFDEAAGIIEQKGDELSVRFARSLREWADVKAGQC